VKSLRDLIREYNRKLQELLELGPTTNRALLDKKDQYNTLLLCFTNVLRNYSTCEKIVKFMVLDTSVDMLTEMSNVMIKHEIIEVRRVVANICCNITLHGTEHLLIYSLQHANLYSFR
jgi:hypothetical protein